MGWGRRAYVAGVDPVERISQRKLDHLELAASDRSQSRTPAGWDDVHLVARALPEVSPADVDLSCSLAGRASSAPLVLVPMTGGHPDAAALNATLGEAAQQLGLPVGVGSQRAALVAPELAPTFAAVRERAPDAVVIGNVGAVQLVPQGETPPLGPDDLVRAVDMVGADLLSIHLNAVQELLQPEGDRFVGPLLPAIEAAVDACPVPVIVKETGAGVDRESADAIGRLRHRGRGVAALDVGGAGGTSFARIEAARAADEGAAEARLGAVFADWGIPTAASVLEVRGAGLPVIATGGVRHGLDAAKALALGASFVGVGRYAITAAMQGTAALVDALGELVDELRLALVLCGARTVADLQATPPVLTGTTLAWAEQRHLLA